MEFFRHAESWVLVSFILFLALLAYLKVPAMLGKMLDERAAKIASELDSARKLHAEAATLLAEYKSRLAGAEKEAAEILAGAKIDAEAYAADARKKFDESMKRRTEQAKQKIARAETAAAKDVRAVAADLAVAAAGRLLKDGVKGKSAEVLIANSISAVKTRLN